MKKTFYVLLAVLFSVINLTDYQILAKDKGETEPIPISEDGNNKCGDLAFFHYDKQTHTLTISGQGDLYQFDQQEIVGWDDFKEEIQTVIINEGITNISTNCFKDLINLQDVEIASTVKTIDENAFTNCSSLDVLYIYSSTSTIKANQATKSAFYGCSDYLTIYTDATSQLPNWQTCFDYYNNEEQVNVVYNTTYQQYVDILDEIVISFVDTDILTNQKVYVDGNPYVVRSNLTVRANKDSKVVTTYQIVNNMSEDIHLQYSTAMKVYFLQELQDHKYQAVEMKNYENILSYAGASIRITGKKGIRIITSINKATRNKLINSNVDGYKVMEYGTLMCWASNLNENQQPVIGLEKVAKGRAYSREKKINTLYKETKTASQYTNTLVGNYTAQQCKSDVAMRSYMIIRPVDAKDSSKDIVIYGCTIYRSISYVALQNKNVFKVNSAGYEYIYSLIKAGYPEIYAKEYKGGKQ